MWMKAWTILTDVWHLFFPATCAMCHDTLLGQENYICTHCLLNLPRTNLHLHPENRIEKNYWGKFPICKASAYLYYSKGNSVNNLLYELKYYGKQQLGVYLGQIMATDLLSSGFFDGVDVLIPIPLHPKKQKKRGYNQSECLAKGVSAITHIPIDNIHVERIVNTNTQTHKLRSDRWLNVQGIFNCSQPNAFVNKHVMLIDDVQTTGATITACADALKKIPGIRISVLTLAYSE